jgi:hypothetical protein
MEKQATLKQVDGKWEVLASQTMNGVYFGYEPPLELGSLWDLEDLRDELTTVRQHWRFENGHLFIGTSDLLYDVVGVPHCGNRYTAEMLTEAGFPAEIHHLSIDRPYHMVMPVRDPRKCLLTHWKNRADGLTEAYMTHFKELWAKAAELRDNCTVYFVDREEPQKLFNKLDLDVKAPEANKHSSPIVDVALTKVPLWLNDLALDWGYE